jgi:hypothetical protein
MMSDDFNRVKSQIGRRIALGGLILAVAFWLAGSLVPDSLSLVGIVRFVLVVGFIGGVIYMAFRIGARQTRVKSMQFGAPKNNATIYFGDGSDFDQVAIDLYQVLPTSHLLRPDFLPVR